MSDSSDGAAPQGLDEKLAAPQQPRDKVARVPLAKLRIRMWPLGDIDWTNPPAVIEFEVMGIREVWRRQGVAQSSRDGVIRGGAAAKDFTMYELERKP